MDLYDEKIKARIINNITIRGNCWIWKKSKNSKGYGWINYKSKMWQTHKLSYFLFIGDIPKELQLDHLCRNTSCVNPSHLEAVTPKENTNRSPIHNVNKIKCKKGHKFTKENTLIRSNGQRNCRMCQNFASKKYKLKIKEKI